MRYSLRAVRFTCPTCKKTLEGSFAQIPTLPFCTPRCRAADLGSWLSESYRIGSPLSEEDLDEGLPAGVRSDEPPDEN
jgi:uncharacterized protein